MWGLMFLFVATAKGLQTVNDKLKLKQMEEEERAKGEKRGIYISGKFYPW